MTSLLLPSADTDAEFARITAALTRRGFLGAGAWRDRIAHGLWNQLR